MSRRLGLIALVLAGVRPMASQEVTLRFRPVDAMRIHRLFQIHTRVTDAGAGSAGREVVYLGGMSQVVTIGPGGDAVVHLSVDSLRTRTRTDGEAWRESPVVRGDSLWGQVRYDERMRLSHGAQPRVGSVDLLTTVVTGLPGFVQPARAVGPTDSWQLEVPLTPARVTGAGAVRSAPHGLRTPTVITLDSLVVRTRDTLAYLRVDGTLSPTARTSEAGPVTYTGTIGGALVWSTAWGNVVSAAVRMRVEARPTGRAGRDVPALTWERTIRMTVRP